MSMRPRLIPDIPEETVRVAQAVFPKGNLYMQMRDAWEGLYSDEQFVDLYPGGWTTEHELGNQPAAEGDAESRGDAARAGQGGERQGIAEG